MTPDQIERIVGIVKSSAGEYPMIYLELLVRRALHEHGPDALPQLSQASEDMAAWYSSQADALEAEGRSRGLNVVHLPRAGK